MPNRPFHAELRAATQPAHERVDAAYGGFDLGDRAAYLAFLTAHARILPPIERLLADDPALPSFAPRTPALAADLARLGAAMPSPLRIDAPATTAARFGMLYVIEGSRLGGGMLARRVPATLPRAYLGAVHPPGGWRAFRLALDAAALDGGAKWRGIALEAADRTFDLYGIAAEA